MQRPIEQLTQAEPGSLEFFLLERYLLYACDRNEELYSGRVWHRPYTFQQVTSPVPAPSENPLTLLSLEGTHIDNDWSSVLFSPGVNVEVFPLNRLH